MIKGFRLLPVFIFILTGSLSAQEISHQVMVPAAGLVVKGSVNYQQTIGETAIEIIGQQGYVITQGFQQPGLQKSEVIPNQGNGVEVYPNPARDFIDIELFGTGPRKFNIEIIAFSGMMVKNGSIEFTSAFNYIQRVDITSFMRGFYFVRVISVDGVINRTFKIEKI
jgi:hypothetical protein